MTGLNMFSFAIFLLSVSTAVSSKTWDSQTFYFSDLLRRLDVIEQRLRMQERINIEQTIVIKKLILENKKFKNDGLPKRDISVAIKIQNETRGLNNTNSVEIPLSAYKAPLSKSKLKSRISEEKFPPDNCCPESMLNFWNDKPSKRSVTGGVAFYSYLSHNEDSLGHHQTIIFDHVITNVGGNYNRHTGIFSCPLDGVYTFSWTLFCSSDGYFISEIVVNSNVVGAVYCNAQGATNLRHTTGVVVVEINQGDAVYIRTYSTHSISGILLSSSYDRSSFSGWKLF